MNRTILLLLVATLLLLLPSVPPSRAVAAPPAATEATAAVLAPGEPLSRDVAEAVLIDALRAAGAAGDYELSLETPALPLANRLTVPAELAAERVRLDPQTGRLSALLVVSVAGEPRYHIAARGRARELVEVPVLARPLAAGEVIAAADLEWTTVPAGSVAARGGLSDPEALVGAEARRRLAAGRVLREGDVGPPLLVRRGRPVTMVYAQGGLSLTTLGRAVEDGVLGQAVRVVNVDSRRQVQGVVAGPDRIDIHPTDAAGTPR